ncbi:MAG: SGNH/GDSL hydrolase family protein [Planctomycetota bacterium]
MRLRGSLANCRLRFQREGKGHVAFMGGSITEMDGYRPMVMEILERRFPDTELTFTDAGIASTCSTTGAFRLGRDVLGKGPVDLFFVEFAVNDDQDAAHTRRECLRGMEGIVRHTRRHNPKADIVIVYFVNPGMLDLLQAGKTPVPMAAHETVARHYRCSTIHLAREVAQRIAAGKLTWKVYGGTHPRPAGNRIAAEMIDQLMAQAWKEPLPADKQPSPYPMPEPLDPKSYTRGRLIAPGEAKAESGWTLGAPDWKALPGRCRGRFVKQTLLSAAEPGAELTLAFSGTAIGVYVLAGPDAGIVEARIDGGGFEAFDLYHRFSRGLHYPRTVVFAADLEPGKHTLVLRTSDHRNPKSQGHAARILAFAAN